MKRKVYHIFWHQCNMCGHQTASTWNAALKKGMGGIRAYSKRESINLAEEYQRTFKDAGGNHVFGTFAFGNTSHTLLAGFVIQLEGTDTPDCLA